RRPSPRARRPRSRPVSPPQCRRDRGSRGAQRPGCRARMRAWRRPPRAAAALLIIAADLMLGDPSVSPLAERLPFAQELLGITFLAVLVARRGWRTPAPALATARTPGAGESPARSRRAS